MPLILLDIYRYSATQNSMQQYDQPNRVAEKHILNYMVFRMLVVSYFLFWVSYV